MKFSLRRDIAIREWPPKGGWKFRQPETGWVAPSPKSSNFEETAQLIRQHRLANPGYQLDATIQAARADLENFTAQRILDEAPDQAEKWVQPIDEEAVQKKTGPPAIKTSPFRQAVGAALVAAIRRLRQDAKGARVLVEWLGSGGEPVAPERANARATVCTTCPHNVAGHKFESAVAETIRRHEEARHKLTLATDSDPHLNTCEKCGCYLKLKIWMPIEKILRDKPPEDLPDFCWIKREGDDEKTQPGKPRVGYHGYVHDATGFGHAARSYIHAMAKAGLRMTVGDHKSGKPMAEFPGINWKSDLHIAHGIPPEFASLLTKPIEAVVMTAWETNRMPTAWTNVLNKAVEVWVPCSHNRDVFAPALSRPVKVIPHPFTGHPEPKVTNPGFVASLGIREDDFVFYSVFVWQVRKSPDLLMEAYLSAFPNDEDRILILKANPGARSIAPKMLDELRKRTGSKARVGIFYDTWSDQYLQQLHARGDCYISLHRGEGFGLPVFDAACMGKAVIATGYSGVMDFLDPLAHRLVSYSMIPVDQQYQYYDKSMQWALPKVDHATYHMQAVDRTREISKAFSSTLAPILRRRFSSEAIGALVAERVRAICG